MYLGIDLGTSSVKILVVGEDGEVIDSGTKDYPIYYPKEGWSEQAPEDWWSSTVDVVKNLSKKNDLKKVKGISFSGQMHGLVILDKDDKVIRPALLWNDQRTVKECEYLNNNKIYEYTGNEGLTGFTAPKIIWVKGNEPENYNKIEKIMLPKDYLVYKFSGVHSTDVSDGSGMLLMDVENRKWSKKALEICGVDEKQLAKVYESSDVVGMISPNIADELGLSKDVKIVAGGGDQSVGGIGVGAVEEGIFSVALGTSGVVFAPTEKYQVDNKYRLHSFCHGNGKYHQMGVMLSAMASYKWWVEDINKSKDYEEFNKLAKESEVDVDKMKNLYFLPYLTGERTPHNNPYARAGFLGLSIDHNRSHCTRAVIEGISFGLRDSLELIKDLGIEPKEIRVSGGGSKSKVFKEILATILQMDVVTMNSSEGPGYGAALLAMVGCGKYKSIDECCGKLIKKGEVTRVDENLLEYYNIKYEGFKEQYRKLYKGN